MERILLCVCVGDINWVKCFHAAAVLQHLCAGPAVTRPESCPSSTGTARCEGYRMTFSDLSLSLSLHSHLLLEPHAPCDRWSLCVVGYDKPITHNWLMGIHVACDE